jgi:hypothetical protein
MRFPPLFCKFFAFVRPTDSSTGSTGPLRLRPLSSADKKKRAVGGAAAEIYRPWDRSKKIIFRSILVSPDPPGHGEAAR